MTTLTQVECGSKSLEKVFNNLVTAINRRSITNGLGITIQESDSGVVIALESAKGGDKGEGGGSDSAGAQPWLITPDGERATWHAVEIMDENCNRFSMWVWGGTPK